LIKTTHSISDEIKSIIAAGSRYFYSLRQIFKSTAMIETVTSKIYKPVAVYRCEEWAVNGMDMNRQDTCVR